MAPQTGPPPPNLDALVAQWGVPGTTYTNIASGLRGLVKRDGGENILVSFLPGNTDPLTVIDPVNNTLGYLYILSARLSTNNSPPVAPLHVVNFCRFFDPQQARLTPERVTLLARGIVHAAETMNNPKSAIAPLYDLLGRYPPSLSFLTTLHAIFLQICVATRHFAFALPVLSVPITEIDKSLSDLHYNDNLKYHYYGGVVFAALKRYKEAEEFFEIVVTSPAQTPSVLQVDALKKLTLVQLIYYGKTKSLPKYTHASLPRLLKSYPAYSNLGKIFPGNRNAIYATLEREAAALDTEGNLGLYQQAADRSSRWILKKLTGTYITLSLTEVSAAIGVPRLSDDAVRALVLSMIELREINAQLSPDGILTFLDDQPTFDAEKVDSILENAQEAAIKLGDVDRLLGASREFLQKAVKEKDSGPLAGPVDFDESELWSGRGGSGGQWWDD